MHPTLQLLERLQDHFNQKTVHWFDSPEENPLSKPSDQTFALNWHPLTQITLDQTKWPTADINILFYPKAKERLHWWLGHLMQSLSEGQELWVVGQNDGGIKSLPKRIKSHFDCVKLDSARHCAVYELLPNEHPDTEESWQQFQLNNITAFSLPGVFSAGKLDKGTEVLLSVLPKLAGDILEFGAGCGILTSILADNLNVNRVDAVEIDLLAVRSAKRTLKENKLEQKANVHWSAGTANLAKKQFDVIVTNPPFHQGIRTAYAPTENFFQQAHQWLKPRGKFIWVANDFLNYQDILRSEFHSIEELTHTKGFKVFQAIRKQ